MSLDDARLLALLFCLGLGLSASVHPSDSPGSEGLSSLLTLQQRSDLAQGDALAAEGEWLQAEALWRSMLSETPRPLLRARLEAKLAEAAYQRRELDEALRLALSARDFWSQKPPGPELLELEVSLGYIHFQSRELAQAEVDFQRAVGLVTALQATDGSAIQALLGLGRVRLVQGEFAEAQSIAERALLMASEHSPDTTIEVQARMFSGIVQIEQQNISQAEQILLEALELIDRIAPDSIEALRVRGNLALVHHYRQDYARARDYYQQGLQFMLQRNPVSAEVARQRYNIALTYANEGRHAEAAEELEAVLELQRTLVPGTEDVARTLHSLALRYQSAGQLDKAIESERSALALYREILPDSYRYATSAHALGQLYWRADRPQQARPLLDEALEIVRRELPQSPLHATVAVDLAKIEHQAERIDLAINLYQEAVDSVESLQSRLGGSDETLALFRDRYASFFKALIKAQLEKGQIDEAFETSERYRAQSFLALLNSRADGLSSRLPETLNRRYRDAQLALESALDRARSAPGAAGGQALEQARRQLRDVADQVASSTQAGRILEPRALSAQAVSEQLPPSTRMLSYLVLDDVIQVFDFRPHQPVESFAVELDGITLSEHIARVRILMTAPDAGQASRRALTELLDTLGEQLLKSLPDMNGIDQLVLIPDGDLWLFPFAAARRDGRYIIEDANIELTWSATSFLEVVSPTSPGDGLIAFADPASTTHRSWSDERGATPSNTAGAPGNLPGSRQEAESIVQLFTNAQLFLAEQASETTFRALAGSARILHIASHAYTNQDAPLEAYIQLAEDDQHDGRLMVWEVLAGLELQADLVTLSACSTALGQTSASEGLTGLTRSFSVAGARQVMSTLWPIADGATADFMTTFYQQRSAGASTPEALRRAQQRFISGQGLMELQPKGWLERFRHRWQENPSPDLSHPFYWAGFALYGRQ